MVDELEQLAAFQARMGLHAHTDPHRAYAIEKAGREAAERSATRTGVLADSMSSLPSTATPVRIDGAHGIHFLRRHEGLRARFDYCARIDVPGVLPPFVLATLGRGVASDDKVGPRQAMRSGGLDVLLTARTRSPELLRAFDNDLVGNRIKGLSLRVELTPQTDRLSVLSIDVGVGDGRFCESAAATADQLGGIAVALARSDIVFAERVIDGRPPAEQLEALVQQLAASVAWLSGPVARVGDGVEGRLALDEQPELPCALRVDLDAQGIATMFFRGPIKSSPEKRCGLRPQDGFIDRLLGLMDAKVGQAAFDDAWLIEGDVVGARQLAVAEGELARLRRLMGTVDLGPDGLHVRVSTFPLDEQNLIDAVGSALSMWRTLVLRGHGLNQTG